MAGWVGLGRFWLFGRTPYSMLCHCFCWTMLFWVKFFWKIRTIKLLWKIFEVFSLQVISSIVNLLSVWGYIVVGMSMGWVDRVWG